MKGWIRFSRDKIRTYNKKIKRPYSELEAHLHIEASVRFSEKDLDHKYKGKEYCIKEGQMMMTSKKELALRWHWIELKVWRFLQKLEKEKEIKIESFAGIGIRITSLEYLRLKEEMEEAKKRKKAK